MTLEAETNFFKAWPYGVLKTIHWLAPFATLITIWLGPYTYSSVGFVLFTSWNAFIICLITWLCYMFGLQRKNFQFGGGFIFVPFALIDFIVAILGVLFYGISSLICVISLLDGFRYRTSVVFTYLFATIFCLISGAAFGYFAICVYRAIPNGQFRYLPTMIIEGDRTTSNILPGPGGPPGGGAANPNSPPSAGWRPPT